ncbi:unnamed protein product, partial [Scytosiphon promiscuus]
METVVEVVFVTSNPLPQHSALLIEFPMSFLAAAPTSAKSYEMGTLTVGGSYVVIVNRDGSGETLPGGTNVSLTLSPVVNRNAVGDTGSFNLTT